MNKREIKALAEGKLTGKKKQEVIKWLLKNPQFQQRYHQLKAEHVADLLKASHSGAPSNSGKSRFSVYRIMAYAALLVVLLSIGYLYFPTGTPQETSPEMAFVKEAT